MVPEYFLDEKSLPSGEVELVETGFHDFSHCLGCARVASLRGSGISGNIAETDVPFVVARNVASLRGSGISGNLS